MNPADTQTREGTVRLQVLEAAERCFTQFGSYKTSLQDVAAEAGISRGTVYRYFGDRESLISAYIDHQSDQFLLSLVDVFEGLGSLEDRLEAFASLAVRVALEGRATRTPLVDEETVTRKLTVSGRVTMEKAIEFLIPYFREAKRTGEIRWRLNVDRAAEWAVRTIMSLASTPSATLDLSDDREVRAFVRDHMIRGFR